MEQLLKLASNLGQQIRAHERYRALRDCEKQTMADPEAREIQDALEKQLVKIRQLEQSQQPIEVEDKRELQRLQERARSHPGLQQLLKTQADYFEMMNRINDAILAELRPEVNEAKS